MKFNHIFFVKEARKGKKKKHYKKKTCDFEMWGKKELDHSAKG